MCSPAVIQERLRQDTGGDRAGRTDDLPALVRRKLAMYEERTRPLIEHYRRQGVVGVALKVRAADTAADLGHQLMKVLAAA